MIKNIQDKTDEELVKLALEDSEDFRYLIERYEEKIGRYIRRISMMSNEDVEDLLQEVFISVYRNLNDFDSGLKFSSWIYRIAHNKVISRWRKDKNAPKVLRSEESLEIFNIIEDKDDFFAKLVQRDDGKEVYKILNTLKLEYKEVLILKFLEDKSYLEIADILKKPMGTIATLINRAKKQFKSKVLQDDLNTKD